MKKTTNIRKILGANVKYYRFQRKYTQEQLAEKTNLSPRYINDIETANGNISIDTLENISNTLGVEAYILLIPQKPQNLLKRVNMKLN